MLYEGTYTNKEIAEILHCSESLIYKWKRENKLFQQARRQYETMIIEDKYVSEAMQSIYALVKTAKSNLSCTLEVKSSKALKKFILLFKISSLSIG